MSRHERALRRMFERKARARGEEHVPPPEETTTMVIPESVRKLGRAGERDGLAAAVAPQEP